MSAALVPVEIVYLEGAFWAVVLLGFVFGFVALTNGEWFTGVGLSAVVISGVFIYFAWHALADYPLVYRDGDRPERTASGLDFYDHWTLDSGGKADTQFTIEGGADADALAGTLAVEYGCPGASVEWRVYTGGNLLASGTLGEGGSREFKGVAVSPAQSPIVVRIFAARTDSDSCQAILHWQNAGLEGPGNGKFRFFFPAPEPE